ncbi:MAG: hypothetical protein J6R43_04585, partial [Paludibacteraceae bacterium]|nr:hypothetical protein [Paludibacteraceae bacterium]
NFAKIQHFFLITKQICIFFECKYEKKYLKIKIGKSGVLGRGAYCILEGGAKVGRRLLAGCCIVYLE